MSFYANTVVCRGLLHFLFLDYMLAVITAPIIAQVITIAKIILMCVRRIAIVVCRPSHKTQLEMIAVIVDHFKILL